MGAQTIIHALRILGIGNLRDFSKGRAEVVIGLLDGPIDAEHPNLRESLQPGFTINSEEPKSSIDHFHATQSSAPPNSSGSLSPGISKMP